MESKIICQINNFVVFLFGENNENDPEQRIYNKLLRLEGDELETWINRKLKFYIVFAEYYCFEGINNPTRFDIWYTIYSMKENSELMHYVEIYDNTSECELYSIKLKLFDFKKRNYDRDLDWRLHIMTDYMEMIIMAMSSKDLKAYIIQQVEPIEIK